jgi:PRC-barrel domain
LVPLAPGQAVGVLGKKVRGPAGEDMGLLVDVLVGEDGQPIAAVIDFGGFLGVGSRKIAVDWRLLAFKPGDRNAPVVITVSRAEVQAAPEYKPDQPIAIVGPASDRAPGSRDGGQ